jgi:hypothetical protein
MESAPWQRLWLGMNPAARTCSLVLSLLLSIIATAAEPVDLFDGQTFTGWEGDTAKTWRIENGEITAGSLTEKQARNEFLATQQSYADFDLTLEFKITPGEKPQGMINAGVQIRSERIPDHHEMIGYQADIGDPKYWGALYDESRRKKILAEVDMTQVEPTLKRDGWNSYRILCQGPRIQLFINGIRTVDYTEQDKTISLTGKIALQIHSGGPTLVRYRKIKLLKL